MVLNRFIPPDNTTQASDSYIAGINSASELLSNQLSNWLSQTKAEWDVNVAYRAGGDITSDEYELALSKQLLNDRLIINGSVEMKTTAAAENSDKFAGDFEVDYKINKKGKIRLRAFNHSNDNVLSEQSPYTQGVGILYKEEFNSLGELLNYYWAALTGKRKKINTEEADVETN
jgi:hypothetical protein